MQRMMWIAAVTLCTAGLLAARPVIGETAQQNKMKTCNAEANTKSLKGDPRKDFMKTCLSAGAPAANSSQARMKDCNAQANTQHLKGDPRKQFMSTCLKSS